MVRPPVLGIACVGLSALIAACGSTTEPQSSTSTSSSGGASNPPVVKVSANPNSVCSAIVTFTVPGAKTARVVATGGTDKLTTPTIDVDSKGQGKITVLGLAASTTYQFVVDAEVNGDTKPTAPVSFSTASLPSELQGLAMEIAPVTGMPSSTGYYLVAGWDHASFAVDGEGVVRWYRMFDSATGDTQMQPDGTITTFVGTSMGWQEVPGANVRCSPDGSIVGMYTPASPDTSEMGMPSVYCDDHDFHITKDAKGNEHYHMIAYEMRPISATNATLDAWHMVQRQSANGAVEFQWKTWSRFTATDDVEQIPDDLDHMNALSIDPTDGNYIVSMRNMDAVIKVDYNTGDVLWQVGGKQATLKVVNDPMGTFYGQHYAHVIENGNLLMFDNGIRHNPPESRAAEYKIDPTNGTATLVWEYRRKPAIFIPVVGAVNRLKNGNTLVAFGTFGVVDEVDPSGAVIWEGRIRQDNSPILAYRVVPLPSLYQYEAF